MFKEDSRTLSRWIRDRALNRGKAGQEFKGMLASQRVSLDKLNRPVSEKRDRSAAAREYRFPPQAPAPLESSESVRSPYRPPSITKSSVLIVPASATSRTRFSDR